MTNPKASLPTPPQSLGLSRRLVVALIVLGLTVIGLFFMLLTRYSPRVNEQPRSAAPPVAANQADSRLQIAKIVRERPHPVGQNIKTTASATIHARPRSASLSSALAWGLHADNEFQKASDARISVYHAPTPHPISAEAQHAAAQPSSPFLPSATSRVPPVLNPPTAPNASSEKRAFLAAAHRPHEAALRTPLQRLLSPTVLQAGTLIPATLMTGIHSSLPGTLIAKVRRNVFDTATGNQLLIPQGTTLLGHYDSQIAEGQSRVLMVWSRLLFPNGGSIDLEGMPGADLTGMAGLQDQVNHHYWSTLSHALLFSLFGAVGQLSQPHTASNQLTTQQILSAAIGQQMSQSAMQFMQRKMNIQPTIKIRPGANFNVILTRDMVLPHPYRFKR